MHQVHADEILYIEAFGNYTKVYFENEMIVSHEKISSFIEYGVEPRSLYSKSL